MAFFYLVMQALPPTLPQFEHTTSVVSTCADILYGRKKYVHVYVCCAAKNFFSCRVIKQTVSPGLSVLGGISLKVLLPSVVHANAEFLNAHSLDLPAGPLPTV